MTTIPTNLLHDLDAPDVYWKMDEEKRQEEATYEAVRNLVRNAFENHPADHRTGCTTKILRVIADVLIKEKGWTYREAADAMIMEGVRTGGYLERDASAIRRKKWLAARREREVKP